MTDRSWWLDGEGKDTCPCHSAGVCPRCGERWTDHGGVEEPICHPADLAGGTREGATE